MIFEAVALAAAYSLLETLDRSAMDELRPLPVASRLARFQLSEIDDATVLDLLRRYVKRGDLVVLGETGHELGAEKDAGGELGRMASAIESKLRGGLALAGRHYRLVADLDLDRLRDRYEVVGRLARFGASPLPPENPSSGVRRI